MSKRYESIHCDIVWVGERACRIITEETGEHTLPLSAIEDGGSLEVDQNVDINVEYWLANKEGLI